MTFDEKIELIFDSYTRTLDFEIACLRAELTEAERVKVEEHKSLKFRMALHDAEIQEGIIENLKALSKSGNENMKFKATIELGIIFYKKRFDAKNAKTSDMEDVPDKVVLEGV